MNKTARMIPTLIAALLTVLTLAGCDNDDIDQAYDLNGYWQGSIDGNYYYDRYGSNESWDTEIWFVQDGDFSNGGYGREIDYARYSNYSYAVEFDWEVSNGRIYIDYYDGYHIVIRDYELYSRGNSQHFRGYFDDWDTGETLASFDLIKVGNWSDWAMRYTKKRDSLSAAPQAVPAALEKPSER